MPGIIESLGNISKIAIERFCSDTQKLASEAIVNGLTEGLEKSRGKFLTIVISISLLANGFFLTLLGIASAIDTYFEMHGLGYVLIGALAAVTGALVYKMR